MEPIPAAAISGGILIPEFLRGTITGA